MTPIEDYLRRVSRGLAGMDRRVREDILRELRSHLADASGEQGDAGAVAAAEAPEAVAARYKELYGYGRPCQAIFVAVAAALAVPTLPILLLADQPTGTSSLVAAGFLVALIAYLMVAALKGGSRVGLAAGLAAAASRFASLAALGAVAGAVVPDATGWLLFTASSLILILIGFVPGAAREKWRPPDVTL